MLLLVDGVSIVDNGAVVVVVVAVVAVVVVAVGGVGVNIIDSGAVAAHCCYFC